MELAGGPKDILRAAIHSGLLRYGRGLGCAAPAGHPLLAAACLRSRARPSGPVSSGPCRAIWGPVRGDSLHGGLEMSQLPLQHAGVVGQLDDIALVPRGRVVE